MPQDTPATCDGCGKNFSIENSISCPNCGLVMDWYEDAAKEWGTLRARYLTPCDISYEHKMNNRILQGERTRAGSRQ